MIRVLVEDIMKNIQRVMKTTQLTKKILNSVQNLTKIVLMDLSIVLVLQEIALKVIYLLT